MAEKSLKARICSKYDTYEKWSNMNSAGHGGNFVLKKGEIGVCFVPNEADPTSPTVLFKIGDGSTIFADLPWASSLASDVYDWAKAETKPTYTAAEVGALPSSTVIPTVPTALKNPNALTFTGAATGTYDGSSAKTVNIPAAVTVDSTLSETSTNPVQNRIVATSLNTISKDKLAVNGGKFTGELTFNGNKDGTALDCGRDLAGWITNVGQIEFPYNYDNSEGFYIIAEAPNQDDGSGNYHATAFFGSSNADQTVRLTNIADPQEDADAVTKAYVDTMVKNPIDMTADFTASGAENVQTWATMAKTGDATKYRVEPGVYLVNSDSEGYGCVTIFAPWDNNNGRAVEWRYHSADDSFYTYSAYTVNSPGATPWEALYLSSENANLRISGDERSIPGYGAVDNNKFLRIVNGSPAWVSLTNVAEEGA